jgi:hypothetical protein
MTINQPFGDADASGQTAATAGSNTNDDGGATGSGGA